MEATSIIENSLTLDVPPAEVPSTPDLVSALTKIFREVLGLATPDTSDEDRDV